MSRLLANLLLLTAACLWGGAFVAQSEAGAWLNPGWFTGLRFALAFLTVLPLGLWEARRARQKLRGVMGLVALAAIFAISSFLQQWALSFTSVTHAGFLTGLYVIFVPVLEMVVLRRAAHPTVWGAALLALAGTWCLGGRISGLGFGDALIIVSAFGFAAQIVLLQHVARHTGRQVAAALAQSAACVLLGSGAGAVMSPLHLSAIYACLPQLLYGGIISGGVAFLLQALCQRHTGATDAAVMLMSESLFAALFAALLLHERLSETGWAGCALLFGALALAQFGPAIWPARRRALL
ncbi:DMT family transporter [Acidocella facilis]|uniref:DMT family transporter n=1 Tax=Acidocella facilis TaxID=525 RepID=UPI001F414B3A|nr:DMT family transporter [Acidocella facilis]